jgi:hypothetical protein
MIESHLDGIDTETRSAIATLAAQFALGEVEEPEGVDADGAIDEWGTMGFIDPTGEQVKSAVDEAIRLARMLDVGDCSGEASLRKQILGY